MIAKVTLPPAVSQALSRFKAALHGRFGERVSAVVLFGSHARGDANEDSDVDVLVAIDDLTEAERLVVVDLAVDVDRSLPEWVGLSPLVYSTAQASKMRSAGRRLF